MWNRRYYYREKIKKAACWALIIILLPYIVTVFVNGPKIVTASKVDEMTIDVKGGGKMPVEKYCIGILARDMPAEYEEEALKAQAILVRTEVYRAIRDAGEGQKLEKEFWTEKQMKSAWGMRYAEVLGKEEYPYLQIVECPEDVNAEDEIQTVVLGEKDIGTMDVEVVETDSVGYVLKIRVGDNTISGEEFRNKYNLASSCFTLQRYNGKLRVTTRGTGHGIGMSQYTANEMAKKKKSYKNILKYFFNGTEIKEVTEIVKGV